MKMLEKEQEVTLISRTAAGGQMLSRTVQEPSHPAIEAIKRDASTRPLDYVLNYLVPAEGE